MVVKGEITVKPDEMEHRVHPVANHGFLSRKAKCQQRNIFRDVGRHGSPDGISGDFLRTEAMPMCLSQLEPSHLTHSANGIRESCSICALATRDAVLAVYVAKAKGRTLIVIINGFRIANADMCALVWFSFFKLFLQQGAS